MPPLTEQSKLIIVLFGLGIVSIGYLWLIVQAFQTKILWGLLTVLLAPLGGAIFTVVHFKRAFLPLLVVLLGVVVSVAPYFFPDPPAAPIVEQKDDGKHGTISGGGAEKSAADFIRENKDIAVLQMANRKDVTDDTLELLRGAPNLKELDLNDNPITDKGLEILATLPKLETVRIARTKATPEGVQKHILTSQTIREIDVGGLNVPSKALRDWKNADSQNRKYIN